MYHADLKNKTDKHPCPHGVYIWVRKMQHKLDKLIKTYGVLDSKKESLFLEIEQKRELNCDKGGIEI